MRKRITSEDEVLIYHKICDLSRICKKYFFARLHLPEDCWSVDDTVSSIILKTKDLKETYKNIRSHNQDE